MRTKAKIDTNQQAIVEELRSHGLSVVSLAAVGDGMGDIIVGFGGRNYLYEVKDPGKPPSKRGTTNDQERFRRGWKGHYAVVETAEQILGNMGIYWRA